MIEVPRSPRSKRPIQSTNWMTIGWSRPRRVRIAAICSGLATSPARIAAGSPGARRKRRNTIVATTPMTGIVARMRPVRKRPMRRPMRLLPLHLFDIPEHRRRSAQYAFHIASCRDRARILARWKIGAELIGALLHVRGDALLFRRIEFAGIGVTQLFDPGIVNPTQPAAGLSAGIDADIGERVHHVGVDPGRVENVPATLCRRVLVDAAPDPRPPRPP